MSNTNNHKTLPDALCVDNRIAAKRAEVLITLGSIIDDLKRINRCLSSIEALTQPVSSSPENERNSLQTKMHHLLLELENWKNLNPKSPGRAR
jgi:hypothetical protein